MNCPKCSSVMDSLPYRGGESYHCYNCHHGIIKPHKIRSIIWNILYGLKQFLMNPPECITPISKRKSGKNEEQKHHP